MSFSRYLRGGADLPPKGPNLIPTQKALRVKGSKDITISKRRMSIVNYYFIIHFTHEMTPTSNFS